MSFCSFVGRSSDFLSLLRLYLFSRPFSTLPQMPTHVISNVYTRIFMNVDLRMSMIFDMSTSNIRSTPPTPLSSFRLTYCPLLLLIPHSRSSSLIVSLSLSLFPSPFLSSIILDANQQHVIACASQQVPNNQELPSPRERDNQTKDWGLGERSRPWILYVERKIRSL